MWDYKIKDVWEILKPYMWDPIEKYIMWEVKNANDELKGI